MSCLLLVVACSDPHAPPAVDRLDCLGCHESQFDAVPSHGSENASHSCWICHGTTAWYPLVPLSDGARRHDWFRIERGDHAGYDCWQCHIESTPEDPYDDPERGFFSCTGCHAHTAGRTDPLHLFESDDYTYSPTSCYRCHRRGEGDD